MEFREIVRRVRAARGLTQTQAAQVSGISPSMWSNVEKGLIPTGKARARIMQGLGLDGLDPSLVSLALQILDGQITPEMEAALRDAVESCNDCQTFLTLS